MSLATDGRIVTAAALDAALVDVPGTSSIVSYQIDQQRPGELQLRTLSVGPFHETTVAASLADLFGGRVSIEPVAALEPRPSGKYPYLRRGVTAPSGSAVAS